MGRDRRGWDKMGQDRRGQVGADWDEE